MRAIILMTLLAAVGAWVVIERLPESEAADASPAITSHTIQSIAFDGKHLPMAELRGALSAHAGELLDHAKLDRDRLALAHVLSARGYLAASVGDAQVTLDAAGGAFVSFEVVLGPVFHVRSIEVVGATAKDAGVVTIATGDVAIADQLAHERDAIADRLAARGRSSSVALQIIPDVATATVDVTLAVH